MNGTGEANDRKDRGANGGGQRKKSTGSEYSMAGMPLELVMKLEVRCDALKEYSKLTNEQKSRAEMLASRSKTKEETDRIIDTIAEGRFE